MDPENRALAAILLAVLLVVATGGALILLTALPTTLPIPAGTEIGSGYNVTFTVSGGVGRVIGAWYASRGAVIWFYPSNTTPSGILLPCILDGPWNGTADVSLVPGTYTLSFATGFFNGNMVVTQAIRLVYPGDAPGTNQTVLAHWCWLA